MDLRCTGQLGLVENVNKRVLFAVLNFQQKNDGSNKCRDRDHWRPDMNTVIYSSLSTGCHLDVVRGPSTPHDPESDAGGSLSSWQGHPSRKGKDEGRS
jgi:hypothetical protein